MNELVTFLFPFVTVPEKETNEMDASLLREREAFLKRARAQPTVEKKVKKEEPSNKKSKLPSKKNQKQCSLNFFIVLHCLHYLLS